MFYGCKSLKYLNISNFNTSNITKMNRMFYGCSSLKELVLSNFKTEKVININFLFFNCSLLKELNINNINNINIFYPMFMYGMFDGSRYELKKKIKNKFKI